MNKARTKEYMRQENYKIIWSISKNYCDLILRNKLTDINDIS